MAIGREPSDPSRRVFHDGHRGWQATDDAEQFNEMYAASYARLVGELAVVTGSLTEAEDVVQEAFTRAFVRWRRISRMDEPVAWVRRVALNLAISGWRRATRAAAARLRLRPPSGPEPEEGIALDAGLAALGRNQRAALVMHYVVGLSVDEIANRMGVAPGTVKSRLARGRAQLALHLEGGTES